MKTQDAIEFIEWAKDVFYVSNTTKEENIEFIKKGNKVKELLQRGKKYEQIFNTILNWTMHDGNFIPAKVLIELEQKYFPKIEEEVIK